MLWVIAIIISLTNYKEGVERLKAKHLSILLVLVLLLTSCAPSFESELDKGLGLVGIGKVSEAKVFFLGLMEKFSQESESYINLADIYMEEKDTNKAINILNQGLDEAIDKDTINTRLGHIYLFLSDLLKAEEHFMEVKEESSELGIGLLKLAIGSNDDRLLDRTYNQYKDMDIVKDSPEFFENLLLGYSKLKVIKGIEKTVDKTAELGLKIEPEFVVKAYNVLLSMEEEDLADFIIKKDIYKKEISDLSHIPSLAKGDSNREFINLTSGYFETPGRLDIALLYGVPEGGYYSQQEITLVNGLTGEVISTLKEDSINAYMHIGTFDKTGDKDHIISLWGHAGGSGTPAYVALYDLKGGKLNHRENEYDLSDDEIVFKDNFEFEVRSKKLGINYLVQLFLEDIPFYISNGFYSNKGELLVEQDALGTGYSQMYTVSNSSGGDYIVHSLGLWDTYDHKSSLGIVESYYEFKGNKLVMVDLSIKDGLDNPMPYNYKEVEGYKEIDLSQFIPKKEDLRDLLSFELSLFKETENTIRSKYGQPIDEGFFTGKFISYDKFIAFVDRVNPNATLRGVWTYGILGMENNEAAIIQKYGKPDDSGYNEYMEENYMEYRLGEYIIDFMGVGTQHPYIAIKK